MVKETRCSQVNRKNGENIPKREPRVQEMIDLKESPGIFGVRGCEEV